MHGTPPPLALDHITVVATTLEAGIAHVRAHLGITAPAGGAHPRMGTHNHLLRLGDTEFLEIIAIDPAAAPPGRPRWFDLDTPKDHDAALATWVLRTPDLDASLGPAAATAGRPTDITRGDLAWRIAVADDGRLPLDGTFPTLIEWPRDRSGPESHPAARMADLGCRLVSLTVHHPEARIIRDFLGDAFADARVTVSEAGRAALRAEIETPAGRRVIGS
ncbi:VOC family protein [Roseospira visakhapatnamensis]|uniref:Glyoxalase-like domain-containing protein n=1 Tax=Roseospira visakhapatnamensis TaxID=390880 RepID=A0A7W6RF34_9PROT|nr:VOC family protein [Roseospira visakhapatnamensis]MBB4267262.1 hypothetical protein [Roseospira visakhapatnamensis]